MFFIKLKRCIFIGCFLIISCGRKKNIRFEMIYATFYGLFLFNFNKFLVSLYMLYFCSIFN